MVEQNKYETTIQKLICIENWSIRSIGLLAHWSIRSIGLLAHYSIRSIRSIRSIGLLAQSLVAGRLFGLEFVEVPTTGGGGGVDRPDKFHFLTRHTLSKHLVS